MAELGALTIEQWQAIERISDALSENAELQSGLQHGLSMLLVAMHRGSAALFIPRFCEHIHTDWTLHNIPPAWQNSLDGGHSPLNEVINVVLHSRHPFPGAENLALGAAFPIGSPEKSLGVLLVGGSSVEVEEYPAWMALLRPFARLISLHAHASGNMSGSPGYLELMKSRNTLRAMFDSLPISIYIIDSTYSIVAVNEIRAARAGEKPQQLVGRKCYEKLYQRSVPCQGCRIGETFGPGQVTSRLKRDWLDREKFVEWDISTFPIFDEKGVGIQAIIIEQDVTDKRNLEANLMQSEKLAAVGQLAAGVAHEINNPLTAIIANAQILRREVPDTNSDMLESIKLIEMAGTRAIQVVRNLLGIARKEKYEFEPVDLNETITTAVTLVQHELVGRPIQIKRHLADGMPPVLASTDQLQGVWINLILNAIDAIDKESGSITISSRWTGIEFHVTVLDNGRGIAPDHLSRVFEPFFTTKVPGRGTGLGLSVCMRVIRHHGGNIQVESQYGKWTRFTVVLPGNTR